MIVLTTLKFGAATGVPEALTPVAWNETTLGAMNPALCRSSSIY
jgi:hypothetical protein